MSQADKVRHIMGLVAPRDTRKARPQMLVMPTPPTTCSSPPLSVALANLAPVPEPSSMRPVQHMQRMQHKKHRRDWHDEDDEDVDIDAALRTMDDIAAENAAAEFACGTD